MSTVHFQNLAEHLCHHLSQAQHSIRAAVCWFSHRAVFEVLLTRLSAKVQVELLLEYDSQNIREGGLDFQQLIRAGGQLWACREAGLMHHKFVIVDGRILLTGSFNWTYNSNAENLLVTEDARTVRAFYEELERQKSLAQRIFQVRRSDAKVFAVFPLFENTRFQLPELRKRVSGGAGVWVVRLDKLKTDRTIMFVEKCLLFDADNLLAPFWISYRMWDEALFDEEVERLKMVTPERSLRDLRRWARRMKMGDLIFAIEKSPCPPSNACVLTAIGIIQSHPQLFAGEGFSSFRAVQWLKTMEGAPYLMTEKISGQAVVAYRGAALRVLQEVFGS